MLGPHRFTVNVSKVDNGLESFLFLDHWHCTVTLPWFKVNFAFAQPYLHYPIFVYVQASCRCRTITICVYIVGQVIVKDQDKSKRTSLKTRSSRLK